MCWELRPINKGRLSSPSVAKFLSGLQSPNVLRLPALGAFHDIKLNLLTFLQTAEAIRLDGGEVYEYVLPILTADEAIALGIVKPLHCSCFHCVAISFFSDFALIREQNAAGRSRYNAEILLTTA